MFFEKCLYLVTEKLVCDGGPFEGFYTIFQGDNAGPHQDEKLYKYVVNFCKEKMAMGNSGTSYATYEGSISCSISYNIFPSQPFDFVFEGNASCKG